MSVDLLTRSLLQANTYRVPIKQDFKLVLSDLRDLGEPVCQVAAG